VTYRLCLRKGIRFPGQITMNNRTATVPVASGNVGATFTPTLESAVVSRKANAHQPHEVFAFDLRQLDQFFRQVLEFIGADRYLLGSKFMVLGGRDLYEADNPSPSSRRQRPKLSQQRERC
jgi:hypothetical protein